MSIKETRISDFWFGKSLILIHSNCIHRSCDVNEYSLNSFIQLWLLLKHVSLWKSWKFEAASKGFHLFAAAKQREFLPKTVWTLRIKSVQWDHYLKRQWWSVKGGPARQFVKVTMTTGGKTHGEHQARSEHAWVLLVEQWNKTKMEQFQLWKTLFPPHHNTVTGHHCPPSCTGIYGPSLDQRRRDLPKPISAVGNRTSDFTPKFLRDTRSQVWMGIIFV